MLNYKNAAVHLVDAEFAHQTTLKCVRCRRDMPHIAFAVLPATFLDRRAAGKFRPLALHPCCNTCRKQIEAGFDGNEHYSPGLDRYWSKRATNIRQGAEQRGILFAIDKNDIIQLWIDQKGMCALTGVELDWKATPGSGRGQKDIKAPSLDRIDSQGNYTLDNIQIVSVVANIMKNELPESLFVKMCRKVVEHAGTKVEKREHQYADLAEFFCNPVEERAEMEERLDPFRLKR